jgi:hypothetical protein
MKAVLCGGCVDIRALPPTGHVTCRCGNASAWWTDPQRGIAKVYAKQRDLVRIIGIHNSFLQFTFNFHPWAIDHTSKAWKEETQKICDSAEGYIFHTDKRNCPVAIIGIGVTNDVSWAEEPPWREQ